MPINQSYLKVNKQIKTVGRMDINQQCHMTRSSSKLHGGKKNYFYIICNYLCTSTTAARS